MISMGKQTAFPFFLGKDTPMKLFTPSYYHKFHCLASKCPDSCCKEWEIDIDDETALRYSALPGVLGDHIREFLRNTTDGWIMSIQDGRCPMWRQDGLCEIQKQLGHEALSCVCREFPRLRHDYGDFAELGLELSCPEAARLILEEDYQMEETTVPGDEEDDYDSFAMDILQRSRRELLNFLDTTPLSLPQSLAVMLLYGHDVQGELDGGPEAVLAPETLLKEAQSYAGNTDLSQIVSFFQELEILTPQWNQKLNTVCTSVCWDAHLLAFVKYGIYRYWYQAVSDYDLICRVKFILIACLLIGSLQGSIVENAQLFSKEIENDPDNVDAILDAAYNYPGFTDVHLLSLLINS